MEQIEKNQLSYEREKKRHTQKEKERGKKRCTPDRSNIRDSF